MPVVDRPFVAMLAVTALITTAKGTVEIVYPPYLVGYGYSLALVGLLTSLFAVVQLVSRVPVGLAYRPERAKRQFTVALAVFGVTASGFALAAGDPVAVVALSIVHGAAFGAAGTLGLALAIDLTEGRHAGRSMAAYTAAISGGYALGSIVGGGLAEAVGIPATMAASGALVVPAAVLVLTMPVARGAPLPEERGPGIAGILRAGARLDARVWLAAMTVMYTNLIWDSLDTFFVVFAPSVGISLATVGVLRAVKSGASMFIRMTGAFLLHLVDHRRITLVGILAAAAMMVALPLTTAIPALVAIHVVLGLARGVLRATSAATIAEIRREGRDVGLASGVYNAGLDVGAIAGPTLGGAVASLVGIPQMFQIVGVVGLVAWLAVALSTATTRVEAGLGARNVIPFRDTSGEGRR